MLKNEIILLIKKNLTEKIINNIQLYKTLNDRITKM